MDMQALKVIAAKDVVIKALTGKHFSICDIDKALQLLGVPCCCQDSYAILSTVHCVDYVTMNPVIREQVPTLVKNVFGTFSAVKDCVPNQIVVVK